MWAPTPAPAGPSGSVRQAAHRVFCSAGLHAAARGLLGAPAFRVLPDAAERAYLPAEEQAPHGGVRLQRLLQQWRRPAGAGPTPRPAPQAAAAGKRPLPVSLLSCPSAEPPVPTGLLQGQVSPSPSPLGPGWCWPCHSPALLSLPPDKLMQPSSTWPSPQPEWEVSFFSKAAHAAGTGWYSECLLPLLTVSYMYFSLLWLQYRPPRKEGLNQSTGHSLCTAICGLDLHNGPDCSE